MKKLEEYVSKYITERYMNNDEYAEYKKAGKPKVEKTNNVHKIIELLKDQIACDDISVSKGSDSLFHVEIIDPFNYYSADDSQLESDIYIPDNVVIDKIQINDDIYIQEKILKLCVNNGTFRFPQIISGKGYDNSEMEFTDNDLKGVNKIVFPNNVTIDNEVTKGIEFNIKNEMDIFMDCKFGKLGIDFYCPNSNITLGENFVIDSPWDDRNYEIYFASKTFTFNDFNIKAIGNIYIMAQTLTGKSISLNEEGGILNLQAVNITLNEINGFDELFIGKPSKYKNLATINSTLNITNKGTIRFADVDDSIENVHILNKQLKIMIGGVDSKYMEINKLPVMPDDMSTSRFELSNVTVKSLSNLPKKLNELTLNDVNVKTLDGCPKYVHKIDINSCHQLINLEGAPLVADIVHLYNCENLESLQGAPQDNEDEFYIWKCPKVTSLEGISKDVAKITFKENGKEISKREIYNYLN